VVQYAPRSTIDQDLWLVDLKSARSSRLTSNARLEDRPVWSEDGKRVVFTGTGEAGSLFEQSIGSEQDARLLLESSQHKIPTSIARDGRFLLYTSVTNGSTRLDVWVLPLTGERKPYPLIRRAFDPVNRRENFMFRNFFLINGMHRAEVSTRDQFPLGDPLWRGELLTVA